MLKEKIIEEVIKQFDVTAYELHNKTQLRQPQRIVEAKQVAAHLLWKYRCGTLEQIAVTLAYPSKVNISKADESVKIIMSANRAFRERVEKLEKSILRD